MKELSKLAKNVNPSTTLAIDAMAKQMRADGLDVIGFGAGEPDFETPVNIQDVGVEAIRKGKTKYTPAAGIVELRKAAAARLKADCGLDYDYTQIVVASGAKHNVYIALAVLINPGDEVIVPAPYWVSYCEMISMLGGTPVPVLAEESQHFKITPAQLEAAITDKTKAIILNNPSNPTGAVYPKEALKAVADVCVKHDLYIISDEIYDKLVYDGVPFTSVAALSDEIKAHTILINGVSKTYAMTGWRIGYALSPAPVAKAMTNYLSHSTGAPGTMCQCAAIEALSGPQDEADQMRQVFEQRRDLIVRRINAMPGVSCRKPSGAFYVFVNLDQILGKQIDGQVIGSGDDFAKLLLEKSLVAVVPGSGFGAPNFVRLSYAISTENIETGMDRLEAFLKQLQ